MEFTSRLAGGEPASPVRFRLVLEVMFPDADPWDPTGYDELLDQLRESLETSERVNCKQVQIRRATTVGPDDSDEDGRGAPKFDFSIFSPSTGHTFGTTYPVHHVEPADIRKVWELLSRAEAGELGNVNLPLAVGQILGPEPDGQAVLWRTYMLRMLQSNDLVPAEASRAIFETAALFPILAPVVHRSDLESLAQSFRAALRLTL